MKKSAFVAGLALLAVACQTQEKPVEKQEKGLGIAMADLDTTVSPCDNFYQYVAGGWMKNNPIPGTESRWGNFNVLSRRKQ